MPSNLLVTEPHPTVAANGYTHSGRGGAGNTYRASSSSSSSTSRPVKSKSSSQRFYSGIGGAGNAHRADERPVMSFDEEFDRAKVRDRATVGHVGVGGAGNIYRAGSNNSESGSSRRGSSDSTSGFWGRISTSTRH